MVDFRSFRRTWLPVWLWMIVIFAASTDLGSPEHTSRFLRPILRWLMPQASEMTLFHTQVYIRKTGHLTEYALLTFLVLRAFALSHDGAAPRWWILALAWCALYALSDEFHQSFVKSRHASGWDVLIDTTGGAVGLLLSGWWLRRARSKGKEAAAPD